MTLPVILTPLMYLPHSMMAHFCHLQLPAVPHFKHQCKSKVSLEIACLHREGSFVIQKRAFQLSGCLTSCKSHALKMHCSLAHVVGLFRSKRNLHLLLGCNRHDYIFCSAPGDSGCTGCANGNSRGCSALAAVRDFTSCSIAADWLIAGSDWVPLDCSPKPCW